MESANAKRDGGVDDGRSKRQEKRVGKKQRIENNEATGRQEYMAQEAHVMGYLTPRVEVARQKCHEMRNLRTEIQKVMAKSENKRTCLDSRVKQLNDQTIGASVKRGHKNHTMRAMKKAAATEESRRKHYLFDRDIPHVRGEIGMRIQDASLLENKINIKKDQIENRARKIEEIKKQQNIVFGVVTHEELSKDEEDIEKANIVAGWEEIEDDVRKCETKLADLRTIADELVERESDQEREVESLLAAAVSLG